MEAEERRGARKKDESDVLKLHFTNPFANVAIQAMSFPDPLFSSPPYQPFGGGLSPLCVLSKLP